MKFAHKISDSRLSYGENIESITPDAINACNVRNATNVADGTDATNDNFYRCVSAVA